MRRTLEAIQAWRRSHNGQYPGRIVDLKTAGLLPVEGGICPDVRGERWGADPSHSQVSSRGDKADPPGTYEYEMSDKVQKSVADGLYLPVGAPPYTRQQLKSVLLRRPFFEQVPILRCSSHRQSRSVKTMGQEGVRRNITVTGAIYWSGGFWEQNWLNDVPYCCRDANVLFGLKGPPFYTDRAPEVPQALDLRPWSCAFGDHVWWWTYPIFEEGSKKHWAPHLRPFFEENHGRAKEVAGEVWWLDGLVQLQGRILSGDTNLYRGPTRQTFVWEKTSLPVNRPFTGASWLQGTVWPATHGETVGWLVWHYSDGQTQRVPIVYGRDTARFWIEIARLDAERLAVMPVWQHTETSENVGKDRRLRLYRQTWQNPRPNLAVTSLDFVSNRECSASPFIVAINLVP